ncbi:hypothetical protein GCM10009087_47990 [Sphingomonas oligophenolica]|uniref:DUF4168 domain-containing protein n=2 Tax=Sphingomonas oligophenolica TaxID=301154 RepID=A0ABU9Y766_9SPHN
MRIPGIVALLVAIPSMAGAAYLETSPVTAPAGPGKSVTREQLHDYAAALVEVEGLQQAVAAQLAKLAPADRQTLVRQSNAQMMSIVRRHGFDSKTFNAVSKAVESQPDLRREVRQEMMEKVMGTTQL